MVGTMMVVIAAAAPAAHAAKGKLEGFQEVPAISSTGVGKCTVKPVAGGLDITLEYSGLKFPGGEIRAQLK